MKKIRLTESELVDLVEKLLKEEMSDNNKTKKDKEKDHAK